MSDELHLTDNEKAQLQRRGPGHHYFTCCPVCGNIDWRSTNSAAENGITVQEDRFASCYHCVDVDVAQRNPELVQWIRNVLGYQQRRARNARAIPSEG